MCAKISPDPSHNPISDGDRVYSTAVPCREGPACQTAVNTVQCQLGGGGNRPTELRGL